MGGEDVAEEPQTKAEVDVIKNDFSDTTIQQPSPQDVPARYREDVALLFSRWSDVRARNARLSLYYDMKNAVKDLGISLPEKMVKVNSVMGWCSKAVQARACRSVFDGFVFAGSEDPDLSALAVRNRLSGLYSLANRSSMVHGLSAFTVMAGKGNQPAAKVRAYSANQFACLWDKDEGRIACGVVLADVDELNRATKYVFHFPDAVLTATRYSLGSGYGWEFAEEANPMGRPMMEIMPHDADLDRPLGHSLLTPELLGIVDKAMRDVLRMEIGAEFFTFPQRYILGAAEDLFTVPPEGCTQGEDGAWRDEAGNEVDPPVSEAAKFKAYIGSMMAITRDENGDVPQVGQFAASPADNFTRVFENDAQRFSGASNIPLAQLGVLSNAYTSSDALGAANDPLILEVETMNKANGEVMREVGRMMAAVSKGVGLDALPQEYGSIDVHWKDPSMPTIAARADAWTKLGAMDPSIVGTRVYYEGVGLPQQTIDRLMREKQRNGAIAALNRMADTMGGGDGR